MNCEKCSEKCNFKLQNGYTLIVLVAGKPKGQNVFSSIENLKKHLNKIVDDKVHMVILCKMPK